jgi:hypothetical protein
MLIQSFLCTVLKTVIVLYEGGKSPYSHVISDVSVWGHMPKKKANLFKHYKGERYMVILEYIRGTLN